MASPAEPTDGEDVWVDAPDHEPYENALTWTPVGVPPKPSADDDVIVRDEHKRGVEDRYWHPITDRNGVVHWYDDGAYGGYAWNDLVAKHDIHVFVPAFRAEAAEKDRDEAWRNALIMRERLEAAEAKIARARDVLDTLEADGDCNPYDDIRAALVPADPEVTE